MRKEKGGAGGGAGVGGKGGGKGTLQKSIDLTPLDPRAGPTGGLGLACPAPTISLTICSLARGGLGAIAQKKFWWEVFALGVVSFLNISVCTYVLGMIYFPDWA